MERWLFLHREPREKIEAFSMSLDDIFEDSWDFSKFVPHKTARQPLEEGYGLQDCLKIKGRLQDQKLVIGQEMFRKKMIRYCFRNQYIWADFMVENTPENYILLDSLFLPVFGHKLESYPHQQQSGARPY